jgi:molybdopterin synthase sulfur carrier subunit
VATVAVRVPAPLRAYSGGEPVVRLEVGERVTVDELFERLAVEHPDLERRVRDERGRVRTHVNLFVGRDNIRDLDGLVTELAEGAELTILPAVSGGDHGPGGSPLDRAATPDRVSQPA